MPDDLEQELRQLLPLAPSEALEAQLAQSLSPSAFRIQNSEFRRPPRLLADRILLTTLSLAAAAAILIVTLLTSDYLAAAPSPTPAQLANDPTPRTTLAQTEQLLAELTDDGNTGIPPAARTTQPRDIHQ